MKRLCKPCGHCMTCAGHKRRRAKIRRQSELLRDAANALAAARYLWPATKRDAKFDMRLQRLVTAIDEEAKRR